MKLFATLDKMNSIEPRRATFYKSYSEGPSPLYCYIEEKPEDKEKSKTHEGFISYAESKVISNFFVILFS